MKKKRTHFHISTLCVFLLFGVASSPFSLLVAEPGLRSADWSTSTIRRFTTVGETTILDAYDDMLVVLNVSTTYDIFNHQNLESGDTEFSFDSWNIRLDDNPSDVALGQDILIVGYGDADDPGAPASIEDPIENPGRPTVDNVGGVYVYRRQRGDWVDRLPLIHPYPGEGDEFGIQVDLDGDTLIVAAPGEDGRGGDTAGPEDNSLSDSGAVFVYQRTSEDHWELDGYLKSPQPISGERFGGGDFNVISVFGDLVAVGVPAGPDGVNLTGYVVLFRRQADGQWEEEATLFAPNAGAGDGFGSSVDLGNNRLVVGAPYEDSSSRGVQGEMNDLSTESGAAYVFERVSGEWVFQSFLKPSNTYPGLKFGASVDVSGDALAVGAPGDHSLGVGINGSGEHTGDPSSPHGAIHLFSFEEGSWHPVLYMKEQNPSSSDDPDDFGERVLLSGQSLASGDDYLALPGFSVPGLGYLKRSLEDYVHPNLGRIAPSPGPSWAWVWHVPLETWLSTSGQHPWSPIYGTLDLSVAAPVNWVYTERFGYTSFAHADDGLVDTERFSWMWFVRSGADTFFWAPRINSWLMVNPDGSFYSFQWGHLIPERLASYQSHEWATPEINRYQSSIFGGLTTGDFGGWVASDRFGWMWTIGDGTWYWSDGRQEWLGVTPDGGIWSTAEGRFL